MNFFKPFLTLYLFLYLSLAFHPLPNPNQFPWWIVWLRSTNHSCSSEHLEGNINIYGEKKICSLHKMDNCQKFTNVKVVCSKKCWDISGVSNNAVGMFKLICFFVQCVIGSSNKTFFGLWLNVHYVGCNWVIIGSDLFMLICFCCHVHIQYLIKYHFKPTCYHINTCLRSALYIKNKIIDSSS